MTDYVVCVEFRSAWLDEDKVLELTDSIRHVKFFTVTTKASANRADTTGSVNLNCTCDDGDTGALQARGLATVRAAFKDLGVRHVILGSRVESAAEVLAQVQGDG